MDILDVIIYTQSCLMLELHSGMYEHQATAALAGPLCLMKAWMD